MSFAQLVHEFGPQSGPTLFEELRPDAELLAARSEWRQMGSPFEGVGQSIDGSVLRWSVRTHRSSLGPSSGLCRTSGRIAEVRIYKRALKDTEIQQFVARAEHP